MKRPRPTLSWIIALACMVLVLGGHLYFALKGWNNTIGGRHDFRQGQTAIATYYIAREGPVLATKIPVLGPDWHVPFEFPTYQTVTAGVHRLTGLPLDQSGRLVSLACFYLSLGALFLLLRELGFSGPSNLLSLALVASAPIYIYWSRAFLIESMAFLLALSFAASLLAWIRRPGTTLLVAVLLLGPLAAVTKFTTFSIIFGFLVLWLGSRLVLAGENERWRPPAGRLLLVALALGLPVIAGLVWNSYIHHVWEQSPLTRYFGQNIHHWNFGTLEQRFSPEFWNRFGEYAIGFSALTFLPWLLGLAAFCFAPWRWRVAGLCLLGAWLSGPLVWANLFYVHDYYYYATTAFGLLWISVSLLGLAKRWPRLRYPVQLGLAALSVVILVKYPKTDFHRGQVNDWGAAKARFAGQVGEATEPGAVVLIIGDDWSPFIPYYAERYALMMRWPNQSQNPLFRESLEQIRAGGHSVEGAVVREKPGFEADRERLFEDLGISGEQAFQTQDGQWAFYPRRSATEESPAKK